MTRKTGKKKDIGEKRVKEDEIKEDTSDESSSDEEMVAPELMVTSRSRRGGAGTKMQQLIESASMEDEFYKDIYGGAFQEDDQDDAFQSPVHSDEDIVDSDFDKSEEEEEEVNDTEAGPRRSKRVKTTECNDDRKKKWVVARMGGACVPANSVDEHRHEKLLKEAEHTEKINVESLKKYEEFELEKKKKREKMNMSKKLTGPRIIEKDTQDGKMIVYPTLKSFNGQPRRERLLCALTGRPARYIDPLTNLPYSSQMAFKTIRDKYYKYLKTIKNNDEVTQFLQSI